MSVVARGRRGLRAYHHLACSCHVGIDCGLGETRLGKIKGVVDGKLDGALVVNRVEDSQEGRWGCVGPHECAVAGSFTSPEGVDRRSSGILVTSSDDFSYIQLSTPTWTTFTSAIAAKLSGVQDLCVEDPIGW